MKAFTRLAFVLVLSAGVSATFGAQSAHAWPWSKKLDLNSIQGKYESVIKQGMPLNCPDTITVVYDAANATLDSEAFHFSNIGRGAQMGATDFDPDHAAYSQQSVETSVDSNSVTETRSNETTSSDTSDFPLDPGPLDAQSPGSAGSMHLSVSSDAVTTTVKYNSHDHTLTRTVEMGGEDIGQDCTFSLATTP